MKDIIKKYQFGIVIVLLMLIKQRLVTFLPLLPIYTLGTYDDLLMARIADCLLAFKWMDDPVMLTKGIGFPLFLICGIMTGAGYAGLVSLCHSIASLLMTIAVRPVIKSRWMQLIFFSVLLFMPAAYVIAQRVYRNSITIWQVLLILASLSGMLLRLNKSAKKLFLWSIPGMIGLTWFYHTREDAIWGVLFATGMLVVSLISLLYIFKLKSKAYLIHGTILALPLIVLFISIEIISALNWHYNGFWGTTFFVSGSFPRMVKTVYSINWQDSAQLPPRLAISRRQIRTLYNYSPTMNKNRNEVERWLNIMHKVNGEVENGHIFWAMLYWVKGKAKEAEKGFAAIADELETAIGEGKLQTRPTMPSALMAPWKPSAYPYFWKALGKSWVMLLKSDQYYFYDGPSYEPVRGIRYLEDFTGSKFDHTSDELSHLCHYKKMSLRILRKVQTFYEKISIPFAVLGVLGFLVIVIKLWAIHGRDMQLWGTLFFLLGCAAACFVLTVGIAYTDATGFSAVNAPYLAGGYPLVWVFNLTAFLVGLGIVINWGTSAKTVRNSDSDHSPKRE